jgi:serine protease Do
VDKLSAQDRAETRVPAGGVRVLVVEAGPALDAGVREGDVLLTLSGQSIDSAERLKEVVDRLAPGSSVPMLIQRDGAPLFLALAVPEAPVERKK